jgi:hypothetical protein
VNVRRFLGVAAGTIIGAFGGVFLLGFVTGLQTAPQRTAAITLPRQNGKTNVWSLSE